VREEDDDGSDAIALEKARSDSHSVKPGFTISRAGRSAANHNRTMSPDLIPAISAFTRVAYHASFTRAAEELGVSPSALSQTIRTLESRLGVRLLERTTRRVGVTDIGRRFLAESQVGLAALAAAVEGLDEARDAPAGLIRLNVSRAAADIVLVPHLADFAAAFPDITLEMRCDNAIVDLLAGNFEAGIRLGELLAPDRVATPLGGAQRLATFAAPRYLAGRTPPRTPADLREHRCLNGRISDGGPIYRWEYMRRGKRFDVETEGALVSNDGDVLVGAARAGAGIACAFEATVRDDFESGRLVPLLRPYWPTFAGFFLYCASRAHMPRKLRVFIDFMRERNRVRAPR
jgi:DNA-binding transcriptional LysR family regulator